MHADLIRTRLARALRLARGSASVHSAEQSGVGYKTIGRLESGRKHTVELSTVYLLALYYRVNLAAVLRVERPARRRSGLGTWPDAPVSLPDTDEHLRTQIRTCRLDAGMGTPALAYAAGVHQKWLVQYELGQVRADVIRMVLLAAALDRQLHELLPEPFVEEGGTWDRKRGRCSDTEPPPAEAGQTSASTSPSPS